MTATLDISPYARLLEGARPVRSQGRVVQVVGVTIEAEGLHPEVGEICHIYPRGASARISAEVIGFRHDRFILMPFGELHRITAGSSVFAGGRSFVVPVGEALLGRILDGFGRPMDGLGPLRVLSHRSLNAAPPSPLGRTRIDSPMETGIRAIDGLITCGRGQRMGIFSGSGVGKSTLIGMIARNAVADVNVIALIGERGREVQDFLERDLRPEGLKRSVVIVSTSDQPALLRMKGAWLATAIAEYFRDLGRNVLFMMDSVTRFAMAQREIGLAAGEPPVTRVIRRRYSRCCRSSWSEPERRRREPSPVSTPFWWKATI